MRQKKGKRKREFLGIYLEPHEDKTYRNEKLKLAETPLTQPILVYFSVWDQIISSLVSMKNLWCI